MLKCCIIYFPGTGGNFLRRVLSLSENSMVEDPQKKLSIHNKFELFNNWQTNNWKKFENLYRPGYRTGSYQFNEFENSPLELIDAWHPEEFYNHDTQGLAWEKGQWQHLVFINISEKNKSFLSQQQNAKCYSCNWASEEPCMHNLKLMYGLSYTINFDSLLDLDEFKVQIKKLNDYCDFKVDIDSACQLWHSWYEKSKQVWHL
jgi:hypothetical protein